MERANVVLKLSIKEYDELVNSINNINRYSSIFTQNIEELVNKKEAINIESRKLIDILGI